MRNEETHQTRALRVRRVTEMLAIVAAFALTAGSAVIAKRFGEPGPALVAVDRARTIPASVATGPTPTPRVEAGVMAVDNLSAGGVQSPVRPAAERGPAPVIITAPAGYERYFNGRPLRRSRTMWMTVTAYSPDARSCGKWADGYTASMKSVWTNGMRLVAADPKVLPKGSLISVPGYAGGEAVPVLDTGGAIKGSKLDVLYPSHAEARKWGRKKLKVVVWEYAD